MTDCVDKDAEPSQTTLMAEEKVARLSLLYCRVWN